MNMKCILKLCLTLLLVFFLFNSVNALAVGISPATFTIKNVLRGGYAEIEFYVSNGNDFPATVDLKLGGDITNWNSYTIPETGKILIQPRSAALVKMVLNPPIYLPSGVYTGSIQASVKPLEVKSTGGSYAAIAVAATGTVFIEISDKQISSYEITSVNVEKLEECMPIKVIVSMQNTGNVRQIPNFKLDIIDERGNVIKSQEYKGEELKPTVKRTDIIEIPYELEQYKCIPKGKYTLNFLAYNIEPGINYNTSIKFEIFEKGTVSENGELLNISHKNITSKGGLLKITGEFKNTGEVTEKAKLKTEIYKDNDLVDFVESEEITVLKDKTENLDVFYRFNDKGTYNLKSYVIYGELKKRTNTIETNVLVETSYNVYLIGALCAAIAAGIVVIYLIKRKK